MNIDSYDSVTLLDRILLLNENIATRYTECIRVNVSLDKSKQFYEKRIKKADKQLKKHMMLIRGM